MQNEEYDLYLRVNKLHIFEAASLDRILRQ